MNEYERDVAIDVTKLDEEWVDHSLRFQRYAELAAKADKKKSEIKGELDVLKAQVNLAYRGSKRSIPEGLKLTEEVFKSLVVVDEEVIRKGKELIEAVYDADVLAGAVEAFAHRKKALEKLVDLFVFSYFGEPKEGRVDRIREMKRQRREPSED